MEGIPRWITIKRIGDRPKLDPVNFVALLSLGEVEVVLQEDGWRRVLMQDVAELNGERPVLTLEKPLDVFVRRMHLRAWRRGVVIGNVHLDVLKLASLPRVVDHLPNHDEGKRYVASLFARRGYAVDFVYLNNVTEKHDGYAVKVFKYIQGGEI
jgi:hypothetical protein